MLEWLNNHLLPCAYKSFLGINCPLCGFQRSLLLLLQGEWVKSFFLYPPLLPVLLLFVFFIAQRIFRSRLQLKYIYRYSFAVFALVMLNYVLKLMTVFN